MPVRKMRIELFDGDGGKYSITFEGEITREKALRLMDLVELLGGVPSGGNLKGNVPFNRYSKHERVLVVVKKYFPIVWFSSKEVQAVYEREFGEPISLSTVATYLSRMANRGVLVRAGAYNCLRYKVASSLLQTAIKTADGVVS